MKKPTLSVLAVKASWMWRSFVKWASRESRAFPALSLPMIVKTLNVSTIYGDKTVAYKDAMLERCHVCKGKEHMIYDEIIGESKDTKDADRFAEVEKIEK